MDPDGRRVILVEEPLSVEQRESIKAAVPGCVLLLPEDVDTSPGLMEQVDVCYGSPADARWAHARSLRWVQAAVAGPTKLLKAAQASSHPVLITNVHIHADAVAGHLWGMCLMLTRNLHRAASAQAARVWDRPALLPGLSTLAGRTLCVAGMGWIGRRCAAIGKAFGMRVVGIRRNPGLPAAEADEVVGPEARREAFSRARVVMLALPGTEETRGFVGAEELAVMRGAYLLNGGRGTCVDTGALEHALRDGRLRGAGMDTVEPEPLPPEHPLWSAPNLIITPHYAGDHPGYAAEALAVFLDNLGRFQRGEPLVNKVDREKGY
jgi:D-2-hydroxyacid dehydrogenase (NADP+)